MAENSSVVGTPHRQGNDQAKGGLWFTMVVMTVFALLGLLVGIVVGYPLGFRDGSREGSIAQDTQRVMTDAERTRTSAL